MLSAFGSLHFPTVNPFLLALITPVLQVCMALMCALAWRNNRRHVYLLWLVANQCMLATATAAQTLLHHQGTPYVKDLWVAALHLGSCVCLAQAMAMRLGQRLHMGLLGSLYLVGLLGMAYFLYLAPDLQARLAVISLGMGVLMACAVPRILRVKGRNLLDNIARWIYLCFTTAVLLRPLMLLRASDSHAVVEQGLIWWLSLVLMTMSSVLYCVCMAGSSMLESIHILRDERDHDGLTGLLNRRAFETACSAWPYQRGVRVLVACDLDHFKTINDTYGHVVGDDVLRKFAEVMRTHLRGGDVIARMGGEEFAIALWHQSLPQAQALVERIATTVMPKVLWSERTTMPLRVTASWGLIEVRQHESLSVCLERVDTQLYAAKRAGRNRMCSDAD